MKSLIAILFSLLIHSQLFGIEALGGEITWTCAGGSAVRFQLTLYRDCNSADITTTSENLRVWNHPTLVTVAVNLVSRQSITPTCTQNSGSTPLNCGTGSNGGNGLGAVEKLIFESAPVNLTGIPPVEGWSFTYETTSRKPTLTNIANPGSFGFTIAATMYQVATVQNQCMDNSPQIQQNPYLVVCAGKPYMYMPSIVDVDLDSIHVELVNPLNSFSTGSYNPPSNPTPSAFVANFSALSPTPSSSINAANSNFTIDPQFGDWNFTSFTPGEFCVKFQVSSYRSGNLIAKIEREMVVFVVGCNGTNTAPVINASPELAGFANTISVGSLVNFTFTSTDTEFLQDGVSPQHNASTFTGHYPSGFSTMNGVQGSNSSFSWQTSCAHLQNSFGQSFEEVTYHYVVRTDDDYCAIPGSSFQRFSLTVENSNMIEPSQITCIQTLANGDLQLTWNQVFDPFSTFTAYELYSEESGLIASFPSINSVSTVIPAVNASHHFYLKTVSGAPCSIGLTSDTVQNMQLTLFNPLDGTVTLSWNPPFETNDPTLLYSIIMEYPPGNWDTVANLPFGTNQWIDTIDICSEQLNYQVLLSTPCSYTSSIDGDLLSDRIAPFSPIINAVSIDTLTQLATITWSVPNNTDIEGYVIYYNNVEFDTVFGIFNTTYTFPVQNNDEVFNFSVAAFDSCSSQFNPLFNQTSGRSEPHSTVLLSASYDVCSRTATFTFTDYAAWKTKDTVLLIGKKENGHWIVFDTLIAPYQNRAFEAILDEFVAYEFVVQVFDSASNFNSFSNKIDLYTTSTTKPSFNYIKVATVKDNLIEIKHNVELVSGVSALSLEKRNDDGEFEELEWIPLTANALFTDKEVDVQEKSYQYRVRIIDSCGNQGAVSNVVKTMLLKVESDQLNEHNFLSWNAYEGFNGSILYYNIYRGIDGSFGTLPQATVASDHLFYVDTLTSFLNYNGRICYYIEAVESANVFGAGEISYSNVACAVFDPDIYIPNAFTPNDDELNQLFKPVVRLVEVADYQFVVFDRWGQVIFNTFDIQEGWDGSVGNSGQKAPLGTYTYVLKVKDGNQQEIVKRGHVTLLH